MIGFTDSDAGILAFDGKRFGFFTDRDEADLSFDLSDVGDLKFPWYYFGGGFKARIADRVVRLSIVAPNNSDLPGASALEKFQRFMGEGADVAVGNSVQRGAGRVLSEMGNSIVEGRAHMREWKKLLLNN